MTMKRILVAVDDSPAGLRAAHVAAELAHCLPGAELHFVHVLGDGEVERRARPLHVDGTLARRRAEASASLLVHVAALAHRVGVAADTLAAEGVPAGVLLGESAAWRADLVVLGRNGGRGTRTSYVGSVARHLLELSDVPVLLVPDHSSVV